MNEPSFLRLENLSKDYGNGVVLTDFSLVIEEGSFITLLGPSGCGKTTTLRILAGLETPTSGRVLLEGEDITHCAPEKRPINTVFQNYALFPHMTVFQNIAYGLRIRGVSKQEQRQRVTAALSLVRLTGFERRMPTELSGGQRQRVAIARAVVLQPKVLLLDEPLGALDLQLRREMQKELKQIQQTLGITFVYITHDQEEALNMSTRIVVMSEGKIEQIGTPEEVYEKPKTLFTAGFIGQSNLLKGTITALDESFATIDVQGVPLKAMTDETIAVGQKKVLCLRPQRVLYGSDPHPSFRMKGTIVSKEYSGGMQHTCIALSDTLQINAISQTAQMDAYPIGSTVHVGWDPAHAPLVADREEGMKA